MKILRYAQDDSVDIRIGIILKGAAVRLHARGARRCGSLGSCPKGVVFRHGVRFSIEPCPNRLVFRHEGPVFYGVVPERGLFQARV